MEVKLENRRLVIDLDEFEVRVAERGFPVVRSAITFFAKLTILIAFHFIQMRWEEWEGYCKRIQQGEDPDTVMIPFLSMLKKTLENNPKILDSIPGVTPDEMKKMLPGDK